MISPSRRQVLKGAVAATMLGCHAGGRLAETRRQQLPFRRGVNTWPWFSLTREYPPPRTDYGTPPFQTQRPIPTLVDLQRLRAAGLDFIRLPVDPGPFLAGNASERNALIAELMAAIDLSQRASLRVIVNLQANGATHYWNPERLIASVDAPGFAAFSELAAEIAARLGDFADDSVALEPVNEPPQACVSPIWTNVQRSLLASARAANPSLLLVATGSCGSMVPGLVALDPAPLAIFEPLMFTFHFYEPYLFSHQGAPWMREPVYRALNSVPWPASSGSLEATLSAVRKRMDDDEETTVEAKQAVYAETERLLKVYFNAQVDQRFIDSYLARCSAWGKRHRITPDRILMGEFGALRSDTRYVAAAAADRTRYVADVRSIAERFGFPWAFWNLFDGMGMMDDATRAFDLSIIGALGLSIPAE